MCVRACVRACNALHACSMYVYSDPSAHKKHLHFHQYNRLIHHFNIGPMPGQNTVMYVGSRLHGRDTLMSCIWHLQGLVHEVTRNYHMVTKEDDILDYI